MSRQRTELPDVKIPFRRFLHETEKAVCLDILDESMDDPVYKDTWFPKSQVKILTKNKASVLGTISGEVTVAGWIAAKYGY